MLSFLLLLRLSSSSLCSFFFLLGTLDDVGQHRPCPSPPPFFPFFSFVSLSILHHPSSSSSSFFLVAFGHGSQKMLCRCQVPDITTSMAPFLLLNF
ncbi:hypothetical protein Sjap_024645 [Stephania japonica]|uniref:Secreted protein n=1 Tax=Stephania japonica TaxID=461633 RepID=A0AAP0HK19_9MAGN